MLIIHVSTLRWYIILTGSSILLDPSCVLLPPRKPSVSLSSGVQKLMTTVLAARFDVSFSFIKPFLASAVIDEWGKVRRVDSDEGDTISTSNLCNSDPSVGRRDATFIRVCLNLSHTISPLMIYTLQ